jgi:hypothetical protein
MEDTSYLHNKHLRRIANAQFIKNEIKSNSRLKNIQNLLNLTLQTLETGHSLRNFALKIILSNVLISRLKNKLSFQFSP